MVLDTGRGSQRALDDLVATARRIGTAVESVIDGKAEAVRLALIELLAVLRVLNLILAQWSCDRYWWSFAVYFYPHRWTGLQDVQLERHSSIEGVCWWAGRLDW